MHVVTVLKWLLVPVLSVDDGPHQPLSFAFPKRPFGTLERRTLSTALLLL